LSSFFSSTSSELLGLSSFLGTLETGVVSEFDELVRFSMGDCRSSGAVNVEAKVGVLGIFGVGERLKRGSSSIFGDVSGVSFLDELGLDGTGDLGAIFGDGVFVDEA
jgi:hypothetical protein